MRGASLFAALTGLALCTVSTEAATTVTVHIVNFDFTNTGVGGSHFDPTIMVGDTIHWQWDQGDHSTTSVAGSVEVWDSAVHVSPFTFDHTFSNAGDFSYYCSVHGADNGNGTASGMSGIIHVQAAAQNTYLQTNLVSDVSGRAAHTDANLINAWGLDKTSTGPWWVNANGTGLSLLYNSAGVANSLKVTVPSASGGTTVGNPSGVLFNPTTSFQIATGKAASFLFATEDGTISGWNSSVNPNTAIIKVNRSGSAVYKGLARGTINGGNVLYAANFFGSAIEVFDANFSPVTLSGTAFKDSQVPAGYGPFNVQNINNTIYVTWAEQDAEKMDDVPGPGLGFVSAFSQTGTLMKRLKHGTWMNAPWGLALAPANFGSLSNMLLVGQFGNGTIVAFDPSSGAMVGTMMGTNGQKVMLSGLWGLSFGNGGQAGPTNTLFFAAGPGSEAHGAFGSLTPQ